MLHERGLRFPDDISLCTMGGAGVVKWVVPSVTHLEAPWLRLAQAAADFLAKRVAGEHPPQQVLRLPERLIDHGSVTAPRR